MQFEVTVTDDADTRTYSGDYHTAANAVFGVLRFRENELFGEAGEGLPKWADRTPAERDEFARRSRMAHLRLTNFTKIIVHPSDKGAKKVHRIA